MIVLKMHTIFGQYTVRSIGSGHIQHGQHLFLSNLDPSKNCIAFILLSKGTSTRRLEARYILWL